MGVADNESIVGVNNPGVVTQQITSMVRDNINPDVTKFARYETQDIDGKQVVVVNIQRGTERPYYLAKKGCVLKAYMCAREPPPSPPPMQQYDV